MEEMINFIADYRETYGVEPICRHLPIAPSTWYRHQTLTRDPHRACARAQRDVRDSADIARVFKDSGQRYGARKIWHELRREGRNIARCTVERLMRTMGLRGVVRGRRIVTTNPDTALPCPDDRVNRQFVATAPNQLWISDFTYVSTWQGMAYVAFVIDVFARKIVGWRVSTSMTTGFVLDALNQAICQQGPGKDSGLIHHSDRGAQYLSILYTTRLADAGIDMSVGSVGDSYDNAMAESIIGLFKAEVIKLMGPWQSVSRLEWETLAWVHWYNTKRIHSAIGYITPKEAEDTFYENLNSNQIAA